MSLISNLDPFKCKQALKTACAATLATLITITLHMPHPFWAPSIVIMLLDNYSEGSWQKGVTRFTSTIAGACFAYFLGHFTLGNEIFYYLSIFTVISVVIYGFLIGGSGWLNFGVTFLFLTMYMVLDPNGSFDVAIWRSSEILTGVLCSTLAASLIFPSSLLNDIKKHIKNLTKETQTLIQQIQANDSIDNTNWKKDKTAFRDLLTQLTTCQQLLSPHGKKGNLSNKVASLIGQGWGWWRQSGQLYELLAKNPDLKPSIIPFLTAFADILSAWTDAIENNTTLSPSIDSIQAKLDAALLSLNDDTKDTRNQAHIALIQTWVTITTSWLKLLKAMINQEEVDLETPKTKSLKESLHAFYIKLCSKQSLIPHCLSIGIGCCLVTYVWLLTGWPGGVCAGISALVVGADTSLAKINLKIRLRLYGSILGSAIGLLLFIFVVKNAFSMCLVVFLGVAVFTYFSQNGFTSMYVSWMATMGFVITVIPDFTQTTSISFSFERAFGLIMGLVVMAFVVNFFFPLNYKKQFKEICDNLKKKIAISWSLLGKLNSENQTEIFNNINLIQNQLMMLVEDGTAIARPYKLMGQWTPTIDIVIAMPWIKNYITEDAMQFLEAQHPGQWASYCQQTSAAVLAQSADQLTQVTKLWDDWANELNKTNSDNQQTIAQCWLMLQANERFCNALAKSSFYTSDEQTEPKAQPAIAN